MPRPHKVQEMGPQHDNPGSSTSAMDSEFPFVHNKGSSIIAALVSLGGFTIDWVSSSFLVTRFFLLSARLHVECSSTRSADHFLEAKFAIMKSFAALVTASILLLVSRVCATNASVPLVVRDVSDITKAIALFPPCGVSFIILLEHRHGSKRLSNYSLRT